MGFGSILQANMVWGVIRQGTAQAARITKEAKEEGRFLDLTARRPVKSVVLLTNNVIVASPFSVGTVLTRLRKATETYYTIDKNEEARMETQAKKHLEYEDDPDDIEDTEPEDGWQEDVEYPEQSGLKRAFPNGTEIYDDV